ncbi:MAG: recombinase RecT [Planctomycetota bacterium]
MKNQNLPAKRAGESLPAKAGNAKPKTLKDLLDDMSGEIAKAVPAHLKPARMLRICSTALRTTPNLAKCDAFSFLGCVMSLAQLGLEPNTQLGQAFLIPREVKENGQKTGKFQCTIMIGYQGMMELARRSGASIRGFVVREGDHLEVQYGLYPRLEHTPLAPSSAEVTHAYAVATYSNGSPPQFELLDREQIEERRKRGNGRGPWRTDYAAMAKKSAVRALWPWLPKSSEIASESALEEAQAIGVAPGEAFDPEVAHLLGAAGVDDTAPASETIDPETGEVTHAA